MPVLSLAQVPAQPRLNRRWIQVAASALRDRLRSPFLVQYLPRTGREVLRFRFGFARSDALTLWPCHPVLIGRQCRCSERGESETTRDLAHQPPRQMKGPRVRKHWVEFNDIDQRLRD